MTRVREFIERHFFVLVAVYVLGKVLMRVLLSPALAWDESEAALQAQYLLLGYGSQPPLYMWMQYAMFRVFGETVLAVALLKGLLILCVYYGVYAAARAIGADRGQAVWSSLALLLVPLFAFEAHRDLSHTVAATAFATLSVMFALRLAFAERSRSLDYAGLGVAVGLSLLSKYNLVPVVVALVVAALGARDTRARLLQWRSALAIGIAALVVLPHYLWVADHWDLAFQGNFDKLDASGQWTIGAMGGGLLEFCEGLAGFVILPVLGVLGWLRPGWTAMPALPGRMARGLSFLHRHLAVITLMLLGLVVITASNSFRDRWLLPLYVLLPLLLVCRCWYEKVSPRRRNGFVATLLVAAALQTAALAAPVIWPEIKGKPGRLNFPVEDLARELDDMGFVSGNILTELHSLGGSLRLSNPSLSVIVPRLMPVGISDLAGAGELLIVWEAWQGDTLPAPLARTAQRIGYAGAACAGVQTGRVTIPFRNWTGPPFDAFYARYPAACRIR